MLGSGSGGDGGRGVGGSECYQEAFDAVFRALTRQAEIRDHMEKWYGADSFDYIGIRSIGYLI